LGDPSLNKFTAPAIEKLIERYEYKSDFAKRFMESTAQNSN
jgi:hypothetical protein